MKHFGHVIKNNIQSPVGSFGVDISREERYQKSQRCYDMLVALKKFISKKQSGAVGNVFKEILTLFQTTLDWRRPPKLAQMKFKNSSVWFKKKN